MDAVGFDPSINTAHDATPRAPATDAERLACDYEAVRQFTTALAAPLTVEDQVVQSMPEVSPTKWHLAHTSWFFERFVLHEHVPNYTPYQEAYYYLFNSYYQGAGPQHCRAERGFITRPTVDEVHAYRAVIDQRMLDLLRSSSPERVDALRPLVVLGLNHEQQHQELLLTDIKHVLSSNPLMPAYRQPPSDEALTVGHGELPPPRWLAHEPGVQEIGRSGAGFAYDNESPRHRVYLQPFAVADRPVCNGEYLRFMHDAGYDRPELWLDLGHRTAREQGWRMPIYWYRDGERWMQYTLAGPQPIDPAEPVCHLSYFEADAFARWCGARLPTEAEWEVACRDAPWDGTFADEQRFHPRAMNETQQAGNGAAQPMRCFGDVWEWTASHYSPYPGYRPLPGTLGEYNGKFMCNQFVLRGGSCATSRDHLRATYRNFFSPDARWQFTGLRLARDGAGDDKVRG